MEKKFITICTMIGVILVSTSVATAMFTADPDISSDGTDISNLFPGVTLSAVGSGWDGGGPGILAQDPTIESEPFNPSTGDLAFGTDDGDYPHLFRENAPAQLQFRADFAGPVSFVSLDFIGNDNDGDDVGVLKAYDSGGGLLDSAFTSGLTTNQVGSLSLSHVGIDYILAYGNSNETVGIDNLQWIPAPGAILLGSLGVGLVGWLRRHRTL